MRLSRFLRFAGVFGSGLLAMAVFAQGVVVQPVPILAPAQPAAKKADDPKAAKTTDPVELEKKILETAGLKSDNIAGLIEFLKSRTLNETDMNRIQGLIKRMNGDAPFDERLAAQEELIKIGGQALAPLRLVLGNKDMTDPEIVHRAKDCLRRMEKEKGLGADVTLAVIRTLGRSKDPQVMPTLIGFLPLADSTLLIEAIQVALREAVGSSDKPPQVLVDALGNENAVRRRVAALALIGPENKEKRIRFPELHPRLLEIAKTDKDSGVRFAVSRVMVAEVREKEAVSALINLMPEMTRGQSWQAEELLVQIAGKDAPTARCKYARDRNSDRELSSNKTQREKTRDAWNTWWNGAKDKTDLTKMDIQQTLRGHFVMASYGWNGNGQSGNVYEFGLDDKERNRYSFIANNGLMDAVINDADTLFTVEWNTQGVSLRDLSGNVTTTWPVPMERNNRNFRPKGLQLLENGQLMVIHASGVYGFDKAGKEAFKYTRPEVNKLPQMDVIGAVKMKNGNLVLNLSSGKLLTLDDKGKELEGRKPIQTGGVNPNQKSIIQQTGDDRVILAEQQSIVEYDLKAGKADGVKFANVYVTSIQKLPNGNILYTDNNEYPYRVVEMSPSKEEVWSMLSRDQNQQIVKAYVR
jgi:hypothetical protein